MFRQEVFYQPVFEDYAIIEGSWLETGRSLEDNVKEMLDKGWVLYGNPFVVKSEVFQAMVKPKMEK